jgi:endonuclease III
MRRRAHHIAGQLHAEYASPRHGNKANPLDELVFILLSQMTTHHSFNRVFNRLKRTVGSWEHALSMPLPKIQALIKDAGLSGQKAPRLKAILKRLKQDFGRVSLAPLKRMGDDQAEAYLTSLPGIGLKSAKCILMYSLDRSVLPVDTHVWRVVSRLGLVPSGTRYPQVHRVAEEAVAPRDRFSIHVNAIAHGRRVCLPLRPRCPKCSLKRSCETYRSQIPPL